MSMPAEMPADVKTLPSRTKCLSFFTMVAGKSSCIQSKARQCVVVILPSRSPAFPSRSEPVHTEATVSAATAHWAIHSSRRLLCISVLVPHPPGTTRISTFGASWKSKSGNTFMPPDAIIGSFVSATRKTSNGEGSSRLLSSSNRVAESHLKRTAEIEDLYVRKQQYAESFSDHTGLSWSQVGKVGVRRSGETPIGSVLHVSLGQAADRESRYGQRGAFSSLRSGAL